MYDYKAKSKNIAQLNNYMLAKTLGMFEWENLPETIPYRELEKILQVHGMAFITEVNGVLYALTGSLGGEVDAYNNPTQIIINNVGLKFNATLDIEKDGVLIYNDDAKMGLMPLFEKHNYMLVENDINMVVYGFNTRMQKVISAPDDKTKQSAENYIKKSIDGDMSVIGDNAFFDGVKLQNSGTTTLSVTSMVEFSQYVKSVMYNELGLSTAFNMKKERLISAEIDQTEDSIFPFVYSMMKNRLHAVEKINEKYGINICVDFGSVWHFKNKKLVDDVIDKNKLPDEAGQSVLENQGQGQGQENLEPETKEVEEPETKEVEEPETKEVEEPETKKVEEPETKKVEESETKEVEEPETETKKDKK